MRKVTMRKKTEGIYCMAVASFFSFPFFSFCLSALSVSFHDADGTLAEDEPRTSHHHKGSILNDDCFYISSHFICSCCFPPAVHVWSSENRMAGL